MWVGLVVGYEYDCSYFVGWVCVSVGWVGSWVMKMDPWTNLSVCL